MGLFDRIVKAGVKQAVKRERPKVKPSGNFGGKVMPHQSKMPTPNLMDMEHNPEYWAKHKNKEYIEIKMTPDEYINATAAGFGRTPKEMKDDMLDSLIDEYAVAMKRGDKFPKLQLDYSTDFGQEGRHRAFAAKQAGFSEVPVVVTNKAGSTSVKTGMTSSPLLTIDKNTTTMINSGVD